MEKKEDSENEGKGLKEKFKNKKLPGKDQFVIILLAGVLLLVIAIPTSSGKEKKESESVLWDNDSDTIENTQLQGEADGGTEENRKKGEIEEYEAYLENRLEQILSEIEGVGSVKVAVTVATSSEMIVAKDNPSTESQTQEQDAQGGNRTVQETDYTEETVYVKTKDGQTTPFVVKTINPKVEGVLVVAGGGAQQTVSQNITEAIVALFGIEPHKIKVVKMKS